MVSVRKSHQVVSINFQHWLDELSLPESKHQALVQLWQKVSINFQKREDCLLKAMEMVEILSSLNLDKDSLSAAFLTPLLEKDFITKEFVGEHFCNEVVLLCRGVEQMAAIKELSQGQNTSQNNANQINAGNIDNIRRMLLAMVEDVRAVVIKLAERLCDLRSQKNNDEESRVLAAK